MGFVFMRVVWWLVQPANVLLVLLCLGTLLLWWPGQTSDGAKTWGRSLVSGALLAMLAVALLPLTALIATPLEGYFPKLEALPERVDGVIVLGGALDTELSSAHGQAALTDGAERMTAFTELALRYPGAKLLFTGGSNALSGSPMSEAEVARLFFGQFGLAGRVVYEDQSRDTYENALFGERLVEPVPEETWLLVTSALHMPRAVAVFQGVNWQVTPYPVDYLSVERPTFTPTLNVFGALSDFNRAAGEWLALAAFRLLGRTETLLPTR